MTVKISDLTASEFAAFQAGRAACRVTWLNFNIQRNERDGFSTEKLEEHRAEAEQERDQHLANVVNERR